MTLPLHTKCPDCGYHVQVQTNDPDATIQEFIQCADPPLEGEPRLLLIVAVPESRGESFKQVDGEWQRMVGGVPVAP